MTAVTSSPRRSPIPSTVIRLAVGLASAALGILIELGLDQMVAVAPWLIVTFAAGVLAAIFGGWLGGIVAALVGTGGQAFAIPAWVPAVRTLDGADVAVHALVASAALLVGVWVRDLLLHRGARSVAVSAARLARPADPAGGARPGDAGPDPLDAAPEPPERLDPGDLAVVAQAVRDLATGRTPAQVADTLARHATTLSGAAGAIVYLDREDGSGAMPLGRHGVPDLDAPERIAPRREAASGGRRGAASPAGAGPAEPSRTDDGRVVECAIGTGSATFGLLRLSGAPGGSRPRPGPLVDVLLQVAADAIERGQLRTARRQSEAEAAGAVGRVGILGRLAAELVGGTTIDEVGQTLVDLAVDDLAAGFAVVHVPDQITGVWTLVRARGYPAGLVARDGAIPAGTATPVTRAAEDRAIVEVSGEDGWRAAFPQASNVPAITGVRIITAIPMQTAAAVHGVLTIGWRTSADRARADRDVVAIAADQGAQALERAILHAHDEDARRFQEAFIGVVSHELRTPITTILAGSRLLRRRLEVGSAAAELTDDIEVEADRLSRIVDDLLVLSRLERRHLTIGDEPVHLDHLLTRVLRSEAARWPDHEFTVRPSSGSHVVVGDETYVEQVLRNLISNAAKYSPVGSLVEIVLDDDPDGDIHVGVLDEGPGVAPSEVGDLFSLFYRSPTTAASAAGAGIGLFVSRRLVTEMGGRMWARPRPGGGSEFGFSLGRYPIDEAELDGHFDEAGPAPG